MFGDQPEHGQIKRGVAKRKGTRQGMAHPVHAAVPDDDFQPCKRDHLRSEVEGDHLRRPGFDQRLRVPAGTAADVQHAAAGQRPEPRRTAGPSRAMSGLPSLS